MLTDQLVPLLLVLVILRTERNVMHGVSARMAVTGRGVDYDVEMIAKGISGG